jgi:hypothetical protein
MRAALILAELLAFPLFVAGACSVVALLSLAI